MAADWVQSIGAYFDAAASEYATAIEPAFAPLAAALVKAAQLRPRERVLDLGTGTGVAARYAWEDGAAVTGVDISRRMMRSGGRSRTITFLQADLHTLPFRDATFDAVLAAFALNSSDPVTALRESWRVMRPGARLLIHEWDTADALGELVNETFAEYTVEDPSPELKAFRQEMEEPIPWDDLESADELETLLAEAGFQDLELTHEIVSVRLPNVDAFLRYKLAWPIRTAELAAMPAEVRTLCLNDLRENVTPHADDKGRIIWEPHLVRVRAWKPQ